MEVEGEEVPIDRREANREGNFEGLTTEAGSKCRSRIEVVEVLGHRDCDRSVEGSLVEDAEPKIEIQWTSRQRVGRKVWRRSGSWDP
jgi:hypothetical protein